MAKMRNRASPLTQLLGGNQKENIGYSGRRSEEQVAKSINARLTSNSGAGFDKGDMKRLAKPSLEEGQYHFRIEAKSTVHDSISLKKSWLDKINEEASPLGDTPALTLSFVDAEGDPKDLNSQFVVVPLWFFKEIMQ